MRELTGRGARSLSFGLHRSGFEKSADIFGFDLAAVGWRPVSQRFALYGGLDVDFEFPEAPFDALTRAGFVAGVDTRILEGVRLLVEGGLGLNDRSPDYVSVGLAVRLR